jgi:membrane associated rhomboid family serine protease
MFQRSGFLSSIPPVVKNILILNVLMFIVSITFEYALKFDLARLLGLYYFRSEYFKPFQYVTYMFMHDTSGITHIFFNMFALFMFGRILEQVWGGKRFLIYYLVTGIGAAIIHTAVNWWTISSLQETAIAFSNTPSPELFASFLKENLPNASVYVNELKDKWFLSPENPNYIQEAVNIVQRVLLNAMDTPTIGASGAVFGILLAFGMTFPNAELMLLFPPIPMKAKYLVIGYGLIELYAGVLNQAGDNVAHFAHLGGMIFGFLLLKYWGINKSKTPF